MTKRPPLPKRNPLESIIAHPTCVRGSSRGPLVDPAKFHQVSHHEALILDKSGKLWRTGLTSRCVGEYSAEVKSVLVKWGLFTARDVKEYEAGRESRHRSRMAAIWSDELQRAATSLGINLTKAQLAKLQPAAKNAR
jgi:hypothetical protein